MMLHSPHGATNRHGDEEVQVRGQPRVVVARSLAGGEDPRVEGELEVRVRRAAGGAQRRDQRGQLVPVLAVPLDVDGHAVRALGCDLRHYLRDPLRTRRGIRQGVHKGPLPLRGGGRQRGRADRPRAVHVRPADRGVATDLPGCRGDQVPAKVVPVRGGVAPTLDHRAVRCKGLRIPDHKGKDLALCGRRLQWPAPTRLAARARASVRTRKQPCGTEGEQHQQRSSHRSGASSGRYNI
jgi:hypothetical protein